MPSLRVRWWSAIGAAAIVGVIAATQCSQATSWSTRATEYLPEAVQGRRVSTAAAYPKALADSLANGRIKNTASAAIGEPTAENPAPPVVLLAFVGSKEEVAATYGRFVDGLEDRRAATPTRTRGVSIDRGTFRASRPLSYAVARPSERVLVITIGNTGAVSPPSAALDAMLAAGAS